MDKSMPKSKIPRNFLRRSVGARVEVACCMRGPSETGPDLTMRALDLSEGGARLLVTRFLHEGAEIVLGLHGPSCARRLTRPGKVVWSFQVTKRGYVIGVR